MTSIQEFSGYSPTWCPGCGDWGIGVALKSAFAQQGYGPSDIFAVFGIGCSGNMNDFLNAYGFHGLHGRGIASAVGIHLANHQMPLVAIVGDGDCYGEGGNHFISACRGNYDMTIIVHDNGVYGLTTGQSAPTAQKGYKSKSTPAGMLEQPINPLALAISQGATFVAQAFAGQVPQMIELVKKGMQHKGISIVNVLQPCVTWNKKNTYAYYQKNIYQLPPEYDASNMDEAMRISLETTFDEKFPLGVIYQKERPTYADQLTQLSSGPLHQRPRYENMAAIMSEFK